MKKSFSILIALSLSLFVYLFYRSEKTVVNGWVISLWSLGDYQSLKNTIKSTIPLPRYIVYSVPGGLWLYCVTLLSKSFYLQIKDHKIQMVYVPLAFVIGLEFCQLVHLTQGRFDVWDIACYAIFWLLAMYLFTSQAQQQDIISPFTIQGFICIACFLMVYLAHVSN